MILFSSSLFALSLILDRDRRNAVHGTRARLLRLVFEANHEFGLDMGIGHVYYRPRGTVMFSEASVSHSVSLIRGDLPTKGVCQRGGGLPTRGGCLNEDPPVVTSSGGHSSARYASYSNAFLFRYSFLSLLTIGMMNRTSCAGYHSYQ